MNRNAVIMNVGVAFLVVFLLWLVWPKTSRLSSVSSLQQQAVASSLPEQAGTGSVQALYEEASLAFKNGDMVKAREDYRKITTQYASFSKIEEVESQLADVNMRIVFSATPVAESTMHEVQSGDTLGKLATQYGTTVDLIKISNNLKSDVIRVGQKLRIWNGKFSVFVDKSQNILFLKNGDEILKVYKVSTGEHNSTPTGKFKIVSKLTDPVWFNRGVVVPPESPQNVLGTRWMGFDLPGYGIHGTIEPMTIGQQVTAGCVRMLNQDVEEIYSLLPMGTEVVIVD